MERNVRAVDRSPLYSEYAADAVMGELIEGFVERLPVLLASLDDALQRTDLATLRKLAHQLRGSAGGYGFGVITDAAAVLESAIERDKSSAEISEAHAQLAGLCARVALTPSAEAVVEKPLHAAQSILVIDDSQDIHDLIDVRLRPEGAVIHHARSAAEGIQLARTRKPDLLLLDFELPGKSGLEVCRELKDDAETSSIAVVFLTGRNDTATKVAALDSGAVDYVTKPFDAIELRARVRAALRTKRYQDLLATSAQLDGLTGLWNRAYFDSRLLQEVKVTLRHERKLGLVMLDIDHFKRLNDTQGHPFGDEVLRRVASVIAGSVRISDVLCRYGGEEFSVILRDTDAEEAASVAERIRADIEALDMTHRGEAVKVTASLGIASSERFVPDALTPSALLEAADGALYAAKRGGRNRVARAT